MRRPTPADITAIVRRVDAAIEAATWMRTDPGDARIAEAYTGTAADDTNEGLAILTVARGAEGPPDGACTFADMLLCHFLPEQARRALERARAQLAPGGGAQ